MMLQNCSGNDFMLLLYSSLQDGCLLFFYGTSPIILLSLQLADFKTTWLQNKSIVL